MLNIAKTESNNEVKIVGTLNELDIRKGTTSDGREWIGGDAKISVDQEIENSMTENIVTVKMFSMKLKKDGTPNKVYERISKYPETLISASAAEDKSQVSRVSMTAKISENAFYNQEKGKIITSYNIDGNFINTARGSEEECATFILSGVIGNMREEVDREGTETGRLLIDFIVIGYAGKANVITLVAEGTKKDFIEQHWNKEDTVNVSGKIRSTFKKEIKKIDQGFGEPIEKVMTTSSRELVITGGSASCLDEEYSYDSADIKLALENRKAEHEKLKNSAPKAKTVSNSNGFSDF